MSELKAVLLKVAWWTWWREFVGVCPKSRAPLACRFDLFDFAA
jgi:hypothetical protein